CAARTPRRGTPAFSVRAPPALSIPSLLRKEKAVSQHADFYRPDPDAERIGNALVAEAGRLVARAGWQPSACALTLRLHPAAPPTEPSLPAGFSYRGDAAFYPCSVVKLFLV